MEAQASYDLWSAQGQVEPFGSHKVYTERERVVAEALETPPALREPEAEEALAELAFSLRPIASEKALARARARSVVGSPASQPTGPEGSKPAFTPFDPALGSGPKTLARERAVQANAYTKLGPEAPKVSARKPSLLLRSLVKDPEHFVTRFSDPRWARSLFNEETISGVHALIVSDPKLLGQANRLFEMTNRWRWALMELEYLRKDETWLKEQESIERAYDTFGAMEAWSEFYGKGEHSLDDIHEKTKRTHANMDFWEDQRRALQGYQVPEEKGIVGQQAAQRSVGTPLKLPAIHFGEYDLKGLLTGDFKRLLGLAQGELPIGFVELKGPSDEEVDRFLAKELGAISRGLVKGEKRPTVKLYDYAAGQVPSVNVAADKVIQRFLRKETVAESYRRLLVRHLTEDMLRVEGAARSELAEKRRELGLSSLRRYTPSELSALKKKLHVSLSGLRHQYVEADRNHRLALREAKGLATKATKATKAAKAAKTKAKAKAKAKGAKATEATKATKATDVVKGLSAEEKVLYREQKRSIWRTYLEVERLRYEGVSVAERLSILEKSKVGEYAGHTRLAQYNEKNVQGARRRQALSTYLSLVDSQKKSNRFYPAIYKAQLEELGLEAKVITKNSVKGILEDQREVMARITESWNIGQFSEKEYMSALESFRQGIVRRMVSLAPASPDFWQPFVGESQKSLRDAIVDRKQGPGLAAPRAEDVPILQNESVADLLNRVGTSLRDREHSGFGVTADNMASVYKALGFASVVEGPPLPKDGPVRGSYDPASRILQLRPGKPQDVLTTTFHELVHHIRNTDDKSYRALARLTEEYYGSSAADMAAKDPAYLEQAAEWTKYTDKAREVVASIKSMTLLEEGVTMRDLSRKEKQEVREALEPLGELLPNSSDDTLIALFLNIRNEKPGLTDLAMKFRLEEEFLADLVGDAATTDAFWEGMKRDRSLLNTVVAWIKDVFDRMLRVFRKVPPESNEYAFLYRMGEVVERAGAAEAEANLQYGVASTSSEGKQAPGSVELDLDDYEANQSTYEAQEIQGTLFDEDAVRHSRERKITEEVALVRSEERRDIAAFRKAAMAPNIEQLSAVDRLLDTFDVDAARMDFLLAQKKTLEEGPDAKDVEFNEMDALEEHMAPLAEEFAPAVRSHVFATGRALWAMRRSLSRLEETPVEEWVETLSRLPHGDMFLPTVTYFQSLKRRGLIPDMSEALVELKAQTVASGASKMRFAEAHRDYVDAIEHTVTEVRKAKKAKKAKKTKAGEEDSLTDVSPVQRVLGAKYLESLFVGTTFRGVDTRTPSLEAKQASLSAWVRMSVDEVVQRHGLDELFYNSRGKSTEKSKQFWAELEEYSSLRGSGQPKAWDDLPPEVVQARVDLVQTMQEVDRSLISRANRLGANVIEKEGRSFLGDTLDDSRLADLSEREFVETFTELLDEVRTSHLHGDVLISRVPEEDIEVATELAEVKDGPSPALWKTEPFSLPVFLSRWYRDIQTSRRRPEVRNLLGSFGKHARLAYRPGKAMEAAQLFSGKTDSYGHQYMASLNSRVSRIVGTELLGPDPEALLVALGESGHAPSGKKQAENPIGVLHEWYRKKVLDRTLGLLMHSPPVAGRDELATVGTQKVRQVANILFLPGAGITAITDFPRTLAVLNETGVKVKAASPEYMQSFFSALRRRPDRGAWVGMVDAFEAIAPVASRYLETPGMLSGDLLGRAHEALFKWNGLNLVTRVSREVGMDLFLQGLADPKKIDRAALHRTFEDFGFTDTQIASVLATREVGDDGRTRLNPQLMSPEIGERFSAMAMELMNEGTLIPNAKHVASQAALAPEGSWYNGVAKVAFQYNAFILAAQEKILNRLVTSRGGRALSLKEIAMHKYLSYGIWMIATGYFAVELKRMVRGKLPLGLHDFEAPDLYDLLMKSDLYREYLSEPLGDGMVIPTNRDGDITGKTKLQTARNILRQADVLGSSEFVTQGWSGPFGPVAETLGEMTFSGRGFVKTAVRKVTGHYLLQNAITDLIREPMGEYFNAVWDALWDNTQGHKTGGDF